ncbi:hypothetical protein [Arcticibacter sp. MXS-1]|uniref:hypothetical protein n=1 Tax=Arcticibacter sp. MXS-1 TaxID=3341726 RepID=UPI0035A98AC9
MKRHKYGGEEAGGRSEVERLKSLLLKFNPEAGGDTVGRQEKGIFAGGTMLQRPL